LKAYSQDSTFLQDDIKHFLESRGWEKGGSAPLQGEIPF